MKTHKLTISAGGFVEINQPGDFFRILESAAALIVETDGGIYAEMSKGQGMNLDSPFESVRITNPSAGVLSVLVAIGTGEFIDDRQVGSVVSEPKASAALTSFPDVAVTVAAIVAAANAGRRAVLLAAAPGNTADVKIGDAAVAVARGITLQPGQSMILDTSAAVWAVAVSGTQTLEILEL